VDGPVRAGGSANTSACRASRPPITGEIGKIRHDVAYAIKITVPRAFPSSDPQDNDVYGAQQHAPLLDLQIP